MTRYYPPYVDLDRAYPRPTDGEPASSGWWIQAAYNLQEMWQSIYIAGGVGVSYAHIVDYGFSDLTTFPPFIDVTPNGNYGHSGHILVGQICWVFAYGDITAVGAAAGFTLPIEPADSSLRMADAQGMLYSSIGSACKAFSGRIEDGVAMFYDNLGPLDSTSLANPSSINMTACYRVSPQAAEGRLTDRTYKVESQIT